MPSLIEYPCQFPIKIMGLKTPELLDSVSSIVLRFDADWTQQKLTIRESKTGKYQALTITINANNRQQLDDLYRALSSHPLVNMVL